MAPVHQGGVEVEIGVGERLPLPDRVVPGGVQEHPVPLDAHAVPRVGLGSALAGRLAEEVDARDAQAPERQHHGVRVALAPRAAEHPRAVGRARVVGRAVVRAAVHQRVVDAELGLVVVHALGLLLQARKDPLERLVGLGLFLRGEHIGHGHLQDHVRRGLHKGIGREVGKVDQLRAVDVEQLVHGLDLLAGRALRQLDALREVRHALVDQPEQGLDLLALLGDVVVHVRLRGLRGLHGLRPRRGLGSGGLLRLRLAAAPRAVRLAGDDEGLPVLQPHGAARAQRQRKEQGQRPAQQPSCLSHVPPPLSLSDLRFQRGCFQNPPLYWNEPGAPSVPAMRASGKREKGGTSGGGQEKCMASFFVGCTRSSAQPQRAICSPGLPPP